jgi:hypothetical protein
MSNEKDIIYRQDAIDEVDAWLRDRMTDVKNGKSLTDRLKDLPSAQSEIVQCKDCLFGYRYFDVQNGVTDSWVECRNPEGLNRDVSDEGFCSASCRRKENR